MRKGKRRRASSDVCAACAACSRTNLRLELGVRGSTPSLGQAWPGGLMMGRVGSETRCGDPPLASFIDGRSGQSLMGKTRSDRPVRGLFAHDVGWITACPGGCTKYRSCTYSLQHEAGRAGRQARKAGEAEAAVGGGAAPQTVRVAGDAWPPAGIGDWVCSPQQHQIVGSWVTVSGRLS